MESGVQKFATGERVSDHVVTDLSKDKIELFEALSKILIPRAPECAGAWPRAPLID
ncbi:MAG: hypothetical protein PsegKO_15180 [Pseudohongiellaceae bacterium]